MTTLIQYELLKIIRKKSTIIVLSVGLLLIVLLFGQPLMQFEVYHENGSIKGAAGIAYAKENDKKLAASLTEQYITDTVKEYQRLFENPDNVGFDGTEKSLIGHAYWDFASPRIRLLNIITNVYNPPGVYSGWTKLLSLDMEKGANFYQARNEKIKQELSLSTRKLTDEQKEYWQRMNEQVTVPFSYGYRMGWEIIFDSFELLIFPLLMIGILLASVFAGEYQMKTDSLILTGKYGRTKLITAKIISSFLFGISSFTLYVAVAIGIPLLGFGIDGWNLPVQIYNPNIPYPFTFLQATLINLAVIYLVLFAMIGLTLFLSANMKNPTFVVTLLVLVLFLPIFLAPHDTTGLYNLVLYLLPYHAIRPVFHRYVTYQFGNMIFDLFSVRSFVYAVLTIVMVPIIGKGLKKHQIS